MELWDYLEDAVSDVSDDLPRDKTWLPAEVSVEITVQTDECATVTCHDTAKTTLWIESEYQSHDDETRTTSFEKSYCDEHAEMWLDKDDTYEVVDE